MKKLNKILAIAFAVMFMSCAGGVSPRAIKYSPAGIVSDLELRTDFSSDALFNALQIAQNKIDEKFQEKKKQLKNKTHLSDTMVHDIVASEGMDEALLIKKEFVYKSMGKIDYKSCTETCKADLTQIDAVMGEILKLKLEDKNAYEYQEVCNGRLGSCETLSGYFKSLIPHQIKSYIATFRSSSPKCDHMFVVYKRDKTWRVLPTCANPGEVKLKDLTLTKYIQNYISYFKLTDLKFALYLSTDLSRVPHIPLLMPQNQYLIEDTNELIEIILDANANLK